MIDGVATEVGDTIFALQALKHFLNQRAKQLGWQALQPGIDYKCTEIGSHSKYSNRFEVKIAPGFAWEFVCFLRETYKRNLQIKGEERMAWPKSPVPK